MKKYLILSLFLVLFSAHSYGQSFFNLHAELSAHGVASEDLQKINKGIVFVTLSSVCPCSLSHMNHLEKLSREFKDYLFVGLHADGYASHEEFLIFKNEFPSGIKLINDDKFIFSKYLKAITTPHSFVLNTDQVVVYEGAVTNSHTFDSKNDLYLYQALKNHSANEKIENEKTKPLGCSLNYKN